MKKLEKLENSLAHGGSVWGKGKGKRDKVALRRRTEEPKSEQRVKTERGKRRPNEPKNRNNEQQSGGGGGTAKWRREVGPPAGLLEKTRFALRVNHPLFPLPPAPAQKRRRNGFVRIYMGESPGQTSLTESRGREGLAKVGREVEQG